MVYIPFEDRANNYHVIFLGEVLKELSRLSINGLGKLTFTAITQRDYSQVTANSLMGWV
jgi:ABC-type microcin C transport system permease subunit YejB